MQGLTKNIIAERITYLLSEKNVKQKELARYLNVKDNTISYFCSGTRTPNINQLKEIAMFFGVSSDYLLGLSDVYTSNEDIKYFSDYTGLSGKSIEILKQFKEYSNSYLPVDYTKTINTLIEASDISPADCTPVNKGCDCHFFENLYYYFCVRKFVEKNSSGKFEEIFMDLIDMISDSLYLSNIGAYECLRNLFEKEIMNNLSRVNVPDDI